jgi:outer membrane protein OmpA-like peptidoglycan-associated protein
MTARGLLAVALVAAAGAPARADGFAADLHRPAPPATGYFALDRADVLAGGSLGFGAGLVFAQDLLVARDENGAELMDVVDNRFGAHLIADYGLLGRLQLGARLPVVLTQDSDAALVRPDSSPSSASLGDLRLRAKALVASGKTLALGAAVETSVPIGDGDSFTGGGFELEPALLASARVSRLSLGVNAGYRFRERTALAGLIVDDELALRAALAAELLPGRLWGIGELDAAVGVHGDSERERPAELLVGARHAVGAGVTAQAGVGVGLTHGYGAPGLRVIASVGYLREPERRVAPAAPADRDGDGVVDARDRCPDDPEDADGHEDADGCPDGDNDGDAIADAQDRCPDEAGPAENQGCPDRDGDGDGIVDRGDECPEDAEDADGFADEDGCPDADNDGDGIADAQDTCPLEPEDIDGSGDEDGCPDPDNDADGIPDLADACPDEPETFNGNQDDDGCPDGGKVLVVLTADKLEIQQQIHFARNKSVIPARDTRLMATIAKILILHPEIEKVRVEGHTDSRGSDEYNRRLSAARAEAVVRHLIDKNGIDPARLEPVGVGEESPIADNRTSAGRAANRRVELVIVEKE